MSEANGEIALAYCTDPSALLEAMEQASIEAFVEGLDSRDTAAFIFNAIGVEACDKAPLTAACEGWATAQSQTLEMAQALGDVLVAIGGVSPGTPLTAPQLLMLAADAVEHFGRPEKGCDIEGCYLC